MSLRGVQEYARTPPPDSATAQPPPRRNRNEQLPTADCHPTCRQQGLGCWGWVLGPLGPGLTTFTLILLCVFYFNVTVCFMLRVLPPNNTHQAPFICLYMQPRAVPFSLHLLFERNVYL